jgi:hypothetical protein
MVTRNTRLTFGKHKNKPLKSLDDSYLKWMVESMSSDFEEWSKAAKAELDLRTSEDTVSGDLEEQADAFLRQHGVDPNDL